MKRGDKIYGNQEIYDWSGENDVISLTPEYSKREVRNAGRILAEGDADAAEYARAVEIADNWRAAHAVPLQTFYMHFRNKYGQYLVAQRLKRLSSIAAKLERFPTMSLDRMQDLGGCRVITNASHEVSRVADDYKHSRVRHELYKEHDYIAHPKPDGYRSYHMVYRYRSDRESRRAYQDMLIEIQVRSHLQHIWATAVEMMGAITRESLKSGNGSAEVRRFFALISSLFAIREGTPVVPGTPSDSKEIALEIQALESRFGFLKQLSAGRVITKYMDSEKDFQMGFVVLRRGGNILVIHAFRPSQLSQAVQCYNALEAENPSTDAVLVRTKDLLSLRRAYPNYFMDIAEFVAIVQDALNGQGINIT